jgi:hypothetical protein
MASEIDPKKAPSLITKDWTTNDNKSEPFYLQSEAKTVNAEELQLKDRYAVTVVTKYKSAGKTRKDLSTRMSEQKQVALDRILKYYDKFAENKESIDVIAEEWDINERPNSRLKVLLSVPTDQIDPLPSSAEGTAGLQKAAFNKEINERQLKPKINNLKNLLNFYDAETRKLYGRIPRVNFAAQAQKLDKIYPALKVLAEENDVTSMTNLDFILGMDSAYKMQYVISKEGKCLKPFDKGFSTFRSSAGFADPRTNYFLYNIDELNKVWVSKSKLGIQEFVESYVLNPPKVDFSSLKMFSPPKSEALADAQNKANETTSKTGAEKAEVAVSLFQTREEAAEILESASDFVGDQIIGNLRGLANVTRDLDDLYDQVLNKVPIKGIIESALECLGFRGQDFLGPAQQFLDEAANLASEIKLGVFDIPTIYLRDDFPVVDYLKQWGLAISRAVVSALVSVLFDLVIELIKMLLDFCKECALEGQGKARFDNFNFGGLSANAVLGTGLESFLSTTIGNIQNASIALPGGVRTSISEEQQKLAAQTERFAQNRILTPGQIDPNQSPAEQQNMIRKAEETKQQMTDFLAASSAVLTPGEMGNMMLGCGVNRDAVNTIRNLAGNYPAIQSQYQTDDDILELFEDLGKIAGYSNVLEEVTKVTDNLPEEYKCLCDPDDTTLRQQLLQNKDMSPELIKEQIDSSRQRAKKRLEDLNNLLQKDNVLDDSLPPFECSIDENGNIVPGIVPNRNPYIDFVLDTKLNALYDPVASQFNKDVSNYVPATAQSTTVDEVVPRTIERTINGKKKILFNPDFLDLVGNGTVAFGALPPGAVNADGNRMNNLTYQGGTTLKDSFTSVHWLGDDVGISQEYGVSIDANDDDDVDKRSIGMTQPYPESERLYELANTNNRFYQNADRTAIGGRNDPGGFYTKTFGFSPVPILRKKKGPEAFAPGFQEVYRTFCFGDRPGQPARKIQISQEQNFQNFKFEVPNNVFSNLGVDISVLAGSVASEYSSPTGDSSQAGLGSESSIYDLLKKVDEMGLNLNYVVPYKWTEGKEEYIFTITVDNPTNIEETAGGIPPVLLTAQAESFDINEKAVKSYEERSLLPLDTSADIQSADNRTPQDRMFANLIEDSLRNGPTIFSALEKVTNKEDYLSGLPFNLGFTTPGATVGVLGTEEVIKNELYTKHAYNEIWKDIFCSFTNQIGSESNPYFNLESLQDLDLAPAKLADQECPPHLLDIDALKNRIREEYQAIECLEASFPNVSGIGSSSNSPFQKSNLGGVILLLLRTYITEMFLKCLHIFYWFKYKKPEDVDNLMVLYVSRFITYKIEQEGFITEFEKEIIDLYERNVSLFEVQEIKEKYGDYSPQEYDIALKFLVRQQIWAVSNRMSRVVDSSGDTSVDAILLENWIRFADIQKEAGEARLDKPCKSLSEDLEYLDPNMLNAVINGELSSRKIKEAGLQAYISPLGYLFRKYFNVQPTGPTNGQVSANGDSNSYDSAAYKKNTWSLSPDIASYANSLKLQNSELSYTIGNETLGASRTGTSYPTYGSISRENWLLISSGLMDFNSSEPNPLNYDFLLDNFDILDTVLTYQYGISSEEKEAMKTSIQLMAVAANPAVFTEGDVGDIGSHRTLNGELFYPGYYLNKSFQPNSLNVPPPIQFPDASTRDLSLRRSAVIENAFGFLLGNSKFDYGYRAYSQGSNYQSNFEFATNGQATSLVFNGSAFFYDSSRYQVVNDVYAPHINQAGTPRGDENIRILTTPGAVRTVMLDNETCDRIQDWQNGNDDWGYAGDDYNNTAPAFNRTEPVFRISNDQRYIQIGQSYFSNGNGTRFLPVLVENFAPRYVYDFFGNEFKFIWRYYTESDRDYASSTRALGFRISGDPWVYRGPERVFQPHIKYNQLDLAGSTNNNSNYSSNSNLLVKEESTAIFAMPSSNNTVLNPDGTRGGLHARLFYQGVGYVDLGVPQIGQSPYLSLMDLDPLSILKVLVWERSQVEQDSRFRDRNDNFTREGIDLQLKYDKWIASWNDAYVNFRNLEKGRGEIRSKLSEKINKLPPARRPMEEPLTCNFTNGGFLLEPYVRSVRYNQADADTLGLSEAGKQSLTNNIDIVNRAANGDVYLEGISNIDKFQDFLYTITGVDKLEKEVRIDPDLVNNACGRGLPNSPNSIKTFTNESVTLGDYFKEVNLGLRLSYVFPVDSQKIDVQGVQDNGALPSSIFTDFLNSNFSIAGSPTISQKSKAYFVRETSGSATRTVNIVPVTSVETPFDLDISITDAISLYSDVSAPKLDSNGFLIPESPERVSFMRAVYKGNSGLRNLTKQMIQTDDYALMFKYMFPIDKMLSINNIYSNTYMSSLKNIDTIFDATKEQLRQLLFALLDAQDYRSSACALSNRDFDDSFRNGFDIKGLVGQLAAILIRSPLLIFKGFIEVADLNVLVSRRIVDLIHVTNKQIAMAQMLINQAAQAASDTAYAVSDNISALGDVASELGIIPGGCDDLLAPGSCRQSASPTIPRPDASLFDQIDDSLIPEPQVWEIGLPLFILSLFGVGIPITPFAPAYWVLDNKPNPNWLNSIPPADWLDKFLREGPPESPTPYQPGDAECRADLGLPSPGNNKERLNQYYASLNSITDSGIITEITGTDLARLGRYVPWGRRYTEVVTRADEEIREVLSSATTDPNAPPPGSTGGLAAGFDSLNIRNVPTGSSGGSGGSSGGTSSGGGLSGISGRGGSGGSGTPPFGS